MKGTVCHAREFRLFLVVIRSLYRILNRGKASSDSHFRKIAVSTHSGKEDGLEGIARGSYGFALRAI